MARFGLFFRFLIFLGIYFATKKSSSLSTIGYCTLYTILPIHNMTGYCLPQGMIELREAAAKFMTESRHIEFTADDIVVVSGGRPTICYTMLNCVNKGDEVIYSSPAYPIAPSMINYVQAKGVPVPLREEKDFRFDLEELKRAVTPKTKMIALNSPHNPTGGVLTKEDLKGIADIAIDNDLWVLSDEIYSKIVFDGEFNSIVSAPGMKERTIILEGHSKNYSMTGWRLGFAAVPKALVEPFVKTIVNFHVCVPPFIQLAGVDALNGTQEPTEKMVKEFKERRDIIVDGLNKIEGIACQKPHGAFYVFPNVTEACKKLGLKDAVEFQDHLLYNAHVATLADVYFNKVPSPQQYVRLSYATSKDQIKKGLERIKRAVEG